MTLGEKSGESELSEKRMTNWDRFFIVFFALTIISNVLYIVMFALLLPPHAATSRDIGQIGMALGGIIMSLYNLGQIPENQRGVN